MTRRAAALLALVALAGPALAEPDAKSIAGQWILSGSHEADAACRLKLAAEQTIGGWDIQLPKACLKAFPRLADVTAWTIYADHSGDIGLIDALRKTVFRFAWAGDAYVTDPAKAGVQLVLTRDAGGHAPSAQERMSGGWSLTGMGGSPRCSFTSTANAGGTAGTLTMRPGCAAKWKAMGWGGWTLSGAKLTLLDRAGKPLQRFIRGDLVTYEGEDPAGDLIYFSRD